MTERAALTPRLLRARDAAEYLSLPVAQFERLRIGVVQLGRSVRYDRFALDAHLDGLSGLARGDAPVDEAEAALARFQAAPRA